MNKATILQPNSEYERQAELQKLVNSPLSAEQKQTLRSCPSSDHNTIGFIGLLLDDDDDLNVSRLLILASRKAKTELTERARIRISEVDINAFISRVNQKENSDLSEVETIIYNELASCDLEHFTSTT